MRSWPILVLLALVATALLVIPSLGGFASEPVLPPRETESAASAARSSPAVGSPEGAASTAVPTGTVAMRTRLPQPPNGNLADAPTACIQVVDHATERPLVGAIVRRVETGGEIAFTDERGLAAVPLREAEQLAVVVDGYLLRMVPTRLGSTEAEPQVARLVPDTFSLRQRLHFDAPAGSDLGEVLVRFRPATGNPPVRPPMAASETVLQRAWMEHTLLAGRPVCADVPIQLGSFNEDRAHRLTDGAEVRFVGPGEFVVEVATTGGLVGRAALRLAPGAAARPPLRVALQPGVFLAGTVVGAGSAQPIAGTTVRLQGGDPLGLVATTGADGAFRLGPLWPERVHLMVRHGDHEPLLHGPLQPPHADLRLVLQPLPQSTLRGRVRLRPDLQPLAGATVSWQPSGSAAIAAVAGADGTFVLRATGTQPARLAVQAPGYLPYAELVEPGAPFADYDLWPAVMSVRLAKGLSALLEGIVVDANGIPVANAAVRWTPARLATPEVGPGRRVLEGAVLELPLGTTTGADGSFVVETNHFGPGRLSLATAPFEQGLEVEAIAGKSQNGLKLTQ
jgi:hypothetical protein